VGGNRPEGWTGLAAIGSGIAWAVVLPLVATAASADPVGWRYDDWNRLLTLPLLLLLVSLVGIHRVAAERISAWGRRGGALALVGVGLMLVGNIVEFWLVLLTDADVFAIADPRGLDEWAGSTVGWLVFLLGSLLLLAGGVLLGVGTSRAGVFPSWAGFALGLTSPVLLIAFVLWSASVAATVAPALLLGGIWIALGAVLLRDAGPDPAGRALPREKGP
jgi:hypothetical protein